MDIRQEENILHFHCEQAFYGFFSPHRSIGHIDRVEDSNVFLYSLLAACVKTTSVARVKIFKMALIPHQQTADFSSVFRWL